MATKKTKRRETCLNCQYEKLSECYHCTLSGEPNPEAYNRTELVRALVLRQNILDLLASEAGKQR